MSSTEWITLSLILRIRSPTLSPASAAGLLASTAWMETNFSSFFPAFFSVCWRSSMVVIPFGENDAAARGACAVFEVFDEWVHSGASVVASVYYESGHVY